jgi:hypothetical protein
MMVNWTMQKIVMAFIVSGFLVVDIAEASCVCKCIGGQMRPACSNAFDIPPVCAIATCNSSTPAPIVGSGGQPACRQVQVCDALSRCTWKDVCK